MIWEFCHCSLLLLSASSLFDTDLCSKANHVKCLFNDADGEKHWATSFVPMGSVKWDGWQRDRGDVCHSFKGSTTVARCILHGTQRGARNVESRESLSEGSEEKDEQMEMEKGWGELRKRSSALSLERQSEKKHRGRELEEDKSIWKLVVLMAK